MALSIAAPPRLDHDGGKTSTPFPPTAIQLTVGPVLFPDGNTMTSATSRSATFITYRDDGGGSLLAWDPVAKLWVAGAPSGSEPLYPLPPSQGAGMWGATLMAVGQTDTGGADKFNSDRTTQMPVYSVQCSFTGLESAGAGLESGTSAYSTAVPILSAKAGTTASVDVQPPAPAQANFIRMYLTPPGGLSDIQLKLDITTAAFAELSAAGATIGILGDGSIRLAPAPGKQVVVRGALDASGGLFVNGVQVT